MTLSLNTDILDPKVRENFRKIEQYLRDSSLLKGQFMFFEITLKLGVNTFPHNLGFQPKDVILTAFDESGQAPVFEYKKFTVQDIYVNASTAGTIRCFLGSYSEGRT